MTLQHIFGSDGDVEGPVSVKRIRLFNSRFSGTNFSVFHSSNNNKIEIVDDDR